MKERGIAGSATRPSQQVLDTRRAINGYDGEIRYVDHQLGLLFEKLQSLGLWEDLVVVLTSDHGEGMGEHGMIGHGYVHREQVQVPLMMRVPGQKARQVEAPISLVDVFPTVLGLLGKESWSDFLEQATGIDVLAETAPSQALLSQRSVRPRPDVRGPAYALTSQRWRYVHEPEGRSRLFNWSTDPYELNDLSDSNGEKIEALQEQLTQQIGTQVKRGAQLGDDGADHAIPLEPNTIEELRALGYID
jgi:arylsulfatase A-like enzyme